MKPAKKQRRNKPAFIPEFCDVDKPHYYNLGLAEYGGKVGRRQDVIKLYDRITDWREQLPTRLKQLRERGYDEATVAKIEENVNVRVAWCKYIEDAMMRDEAEFFETIAALIKHKLNGREKAHPIEFAIWSEFIRLMRASERLSDDGTQIISDYPTKGQIRAAYEKGGHPAVTSWPRMWKRLKLDWLPKDNSGPRERRIR